MSAFEDQMNSLNLKLADARKLGVIEGQAGGAFEVMIREILQETERRRQTCVKQAETLRMQASAAEAQAGAFTVVASIANQVLHGMVGQAQRAIDEEISRNIRLAEEEAEANADVAREVALTLDTIPASELKPNRSKKTLKAPV